MKKNTLALFGLVLILGGLVYYFQFMKDSTTSISDDSAWQRDFAIKNIDDVQTVMINKLSGLSIKLTRKGDVWEVNDKYMVNPKAIKSLLNTAENLELQRTPIAKEAENIIEYMNRNGIHVRYFDAEGQVMKSYFLGDADLEGTGTSIVMEGSNQPYIVNVPYFEGILSFRFGRPVKEWRDKAVFRLDSEQITKLSIDYPKQKSNSFELNREGNDFYINKIYDFTEVGKKKVSPNQAIDYLEGFEEIIAEGLENEYTKKDSIMNQVPFCIMNLELGDEIKQTVTLYEIQRKNAGSGSESDKVFRFFCWNEPADDLSVVQLGVFQPLFRSYDYFSVK